MNIGDVYYFYAIDGRIYPYVVISAHTSGKYAVLRAKCNKYQKNDIGISNNPNDLFSRRFFYNKGSAFLKKYNTLRDKNNTPRIAKRLDKIYSILLRDYQECLI